MSKTIVLITGANQGLGLECVKQLAAGYANYHIILCSRSLTKGKEAAATVTKFAENTTLETLELDVDSDDSIAKAAKIVGEKHGHLDVLFNNAGIMYPSGTQSFREGMNRVMSTNAISAACVTEAFIPLMKASPSTTPRRLVFMSSEFGSINMCLDPTLPYYGFDVKPYYTSKAAMNMLAAQYAVQLRNDNFKVNAVTPGFRATNLNGFHELGGSPAEGAAVAVKLLVSEDKEGPNGTFVSEQGNLPW